MSDQLQSLLQQTGAVTPAFPANSRYNKTPIANLTMPDGTEIAYLRRRFVPPPENFALLQYHTVTEGERLDRTPGEPAHEAHHAARVEAGAQPGAHRGVAPEVQGDRLLQLRPAPLRPLVRALPPGGGSPRR